MGRSQFVLASDEPCGFGAANSHFQPKLIERDIGPAEKDGSEQLHSICSMAADANEC